MALTFLHLHTHTQRHTNTPTLTHTHRQAETQSHSRASVLSFLSLDYIKIASAIRICGTKFTFHFALISCHTLFLASSLAFAFPFDILFCVLWVFKVQSIFNTSHGAHTHRHRQFCTRTHAHTYTDEAHIRRWHAPSAFCYCEDVVSAAHENVLAPVPHRVWGQSHEGADEAAAEQATRPTASCLPGSPAAGHIVRRSLSSLLPLSCALFSFGTDILYLIT